MNKAKCRSFLPSKESELPDTLWSNDQFEASYPALFEFLAAGIWEGEARKGGSISLFVTQRALKVCFLDKQTQQAFYALVEPTTDLLGHLEGILAGEHEPWAPVKGHNGKPVF